MSDGVRLYSAGPLSIIALILLIGLVILVIPLLFLGLVGAAFTRLGFSWIAALAVVLLMLFGSFINIPLYTIRRDMIRAGTGEFSFESAAAPWAPQPVWDTAISVNLGGAVIPVLVSAYLLYRAVGVLGTAILGPVGAGIVIVAAIAYLATRSVPGYGIKAPLFIPGLAALLCGLLLTGGTGLLAGVTAFVAGTAGTLLGVGIGWLPRVKDLEVPQVSIGGAGMFGAIFLACILSALIT
ncbi:DUF1614 domain-containing protein [Methanoregula sp.]|uniref:DUF1614 domain-containing protein n=1 Tax=Methanoregula sp. TaxID=2052170 RepID=UPI003C75238B